jgi:hypothetical protein
MKLSLTIPFVLIATLAGCSSSESSSKTSGAVGGAGSGDAAAKKSLEDNLPTAGLAILDFAIDDWSEVAFRRGKLVRFTSPKLLKQALDD